MAESIEEFFTDDRLTGTSLRESAIFIHIFLQGGATTSETIQSLTAIFDDSQAGGTISGVLDECIVRAAEQLPETHTALVELTVGLRNRQQQNREDDLSQFDHLLVMSFGERWARYGDPAPDDAWKEQGRLEWTNLNHFAALCYATGIQALASFGEQTLTMTLRKGGWRVDWNGPENTSNSVIALEGHARAAVHWIIVSGQLLYNHCNSVRTNWKMWIANMAWIVDKDDLDIEIKSICREAMEAMDSICA